MGSFSFDIFFLVLSFFLSLFFPPGWGVGMLQGGLTNELLTISLAVEGFDAFLRKLMLLVVSILAEDWERSRDGMVQSRSRVFVAHDYGDEPLCLIREPKFQVSLNER